VNGGPGGKVDDRVAAGEARRLLGHAVRASHRIQQPRDVRAAWSVLHADVKGRLEDVGRVVAGGDGLISKAGVEGPAVPDPDLPVAGRERGGLRCPARGHVGIEATRLQGGGDLATSLGPLAA
jgi:hypothetical protein